MNTAWRRHEFGRLDRLMHQSLVLQNNQGQKLLLGVETAYGLGFLYTNLLFELYSDEIMIQIRVDHLHIP